MNGQTPTNPPSKKTRVAVFIDNSNVFKRIEELNKAYPHRFWWPKSYDPLFLSQTLIGNGRQLVKVYFYCCPPPDFLKKRVDTDGKIIYWLQMSYYEQIKKLSGVELKFAYLSGSKGDLQEKNLDTQLLSDMLVAAFKDEFDTAILIAGDGDYQSAVSVIKGLGKKLELVYFKGRASMSLKQLCDVSRKIRRSFIRRLNFTYHEDTP